jgi:hypothetical protein
MYRWNAATERCRTTRIPFRPGEAPAEPSSRATGGLPTRAAARAEPVADTIRILAAIVVSLVLFGTCVAVAPAAFAQPRPNDDAVDKFLGRLGLAELQSLHLEQKLATAPAGPAQLALARRLADVYAGRLMAAGEDDAAYGEVLARIEGLVARFPEANTTALQVMLLQADYHRAESQAVEWLADRSADAARQQAQAALARIAPRLTSLEQELASAAEKLAAEVDKLPDNDERIAGEQELARMQGVAGRAGYFAGWSNYYLGILRNDPAAAAAEFDSARKAFLKILGIDEKEDFAKIEADALALDSVWRSRALIGLGLCEAAAGRMAQSAACFRLLGHASVPVAIRDQAAYWQLQGLLNSSRFAEARAFAKEQVDAFTGDASQGKVSLCVALVRTGYAPGIAPPGGSAAGDVKALGKLGIAGLARLRQYDAVRQLMARYSIPVDASAGFHLKWLRGLDLFSAAEKSKEAGDYRAAAAQLGEALADGEANSDAVAAGQCRYTLGWCRFRLEEYETSVSDFNRAAAVLKSASHATAPDSAWMAFAAQQRLADKDPRFAAQAVKLLEAFQRDYPDDSRARRAGLYLARLQQVSGAAERSIETLEAIAAGAANYASAREELCRLYYHQWSQAEGAARAAAAAALRDAVRKYLDAPGRPADPERELKPILYAVEAALAAEPADAESARGLLARAARPAAGISGSSGVLAEYHYRQLQLAQLSDDNGARDRHAQWLGDNAKDSPYELPALIVLATTADDAVAAADASSLAGRQTAAHEAYRRLAARLGDSAETLAADRNALVANSRQAYYASQTGRHAEAADRLNAILAAYPKDKAFLRRAGLANFHAGRFDRSLDCWRTLLAGLPDASDEWYEAKYYQVACLGRLDRPQAEKVFRQFKLLHPNLGPAEWRDKFSVMEEQLFRGRQGS